MGLNIGQAMSELRAGKKLSRGGSWSGPLDPSFIVLVPGRDITSSYEPMGSHLGDRQFHVEDHIDAIIDHEQRGQVGGLRCILGYPLSPADELATDWFVVEEDYAEPRIDPDKAREADRLAVARMNGF